MPRSMADPNYVYRPHSAERRARMSEANMRRLGAPPGHRIVYGVYVPVEIFERVHRIVLRVVKTTGDRQTGHDLACVLTVLLT